jgi:replicative DNA helicase
MATEKKVWYKRSRPEKLEEINRILILMMTNDEYIRLVSPLLSDLSLLPEVSSITRVAKWSLDFQKTNDRAPREYLQKIFEEEKDTLDEGEAELIQKLLTRLNKEYLEGDFEDIALQYELDKTEKYIQRRALEKNKEEIENALSNDLVEDAIEIRQSFSIPSLSYASIGINLTGDPQQLKKLDDKEQLEGLFSLPGDLGYRAGPVYRGDLWAFLAAMKVGKTWWLSKVARMGVQNGLNVFFASLEMSMRKMIFRFTQPMTRMIKFQDKDKIVKEPYFNCLNNIEGRRGRWSCTERIDGHRGDRETCIVCSRSSNWFIRKKFVPLLLYKEIKLDNNPILNVKNSIIALERFKKRNITMGGGNLFINSYPPRTTTVDQVYGDMKQIESIHGIKFDMFVSDYADNFKDQGEYRHQLHEIWSKHKGIALDEDMAVFTASQSNTARDDSKRVTGGSWAEDIRKKGIIDIGIGLDASDDERERQFLQGNIIANRDLGFHSKQLITVLNCYQMGKVHLGSWVAPDKEEQEN